MKSELKVKLLQHLAKNKKQNAGFTLIELLVVVIIIGVLAAIALPNFLNQSAKAKQSEAKTTIGSVNSAQTAYRQENSSFADDMEALALGLPTATANYKYTIDGETDLGKIKAEKTDSALKHYVGAAARRTASGQSIVNSVICEAKSTETEVTDATGGGTDPAACPTDNFNQLGAAAPAETPAETPASPG